MDHPESIFRLDEYAEAGRRFITEAVEALARASSPLLAQIPVERVDATAVTRTSLDGGLTLDHDPHLVESVMTLETADEVEGEFGGFHLAISDMGESFAAQLVPILLGQISDICDAAGNVVNGAGDSIWESYLRALESIEISFDPSGEPHLPTLVVHPDTADRFPPQPADFYERRDQILREKQDEWLATRRTRRLSLESL